MNTEAKSYLETLVFIYRSTQRDIPEEENILYFYHNGTSVVVILNAKKITEYFSL